MTSAELIPAVILKRKAVVCVRQSTQSQVMINLESKRRQYDLVDVARQRGFVDVEIIDDDLGRSASGTVARPGFDRKRADASGHLGHNLDLWHSTPRDSRHALVCIIRASCRADALGFLLWPQIA